MPGATSVARHPEGRLPGPPHLVTLAGEVMLSRRRYRCLACGGEVVPIDEALGLEPRLQHTLGVRVGASGS